MITETDQKAGGGLTEASASLLEEIIEKNGAVAIGARGRAKKKLVELGYIHTEGRAAGRATTEGKKALKTFRKPAKAERKSADRTARKRAAAN